MRKHQESVRVCTLTDLVDGPADADHTIILNGLEVIILGQTGTDDVAVACYGSVEAFPARTVVLEVIPGSQRPYTVFHLVYLMGLWCDHLPRVEGEEVPRLPDYGVIRAHAIRAHEAGYIDWEDLDEFLEVFNLPRYPADQTKA